MKNLVTAIATSGHLIKQNNKIAKPSGLDFDGTNDYLSRASDLTGNADSKTFTFSGWFYSDDTNGKLFHIDNGSGGTRFQIEYEATTGKLKCIGTDGTANNIISETVTNAVPKDTWNHVLISVDTSSTSLRHVYINDTPYNTWNSYTLNTVIDFTTNYTSIASAIYSGGLYGQLKGRLAHVYLDYQYRDLSIEANRRLFTTYDPFLKPADLTALENQITVGAGSDGWLTPTTGGTKFDGTTNYLSRASDLVGNSDGKTFTFSGWVYYTSNGAEIWGADDSVADAEIQCYVATDGEFRMLFQDGAGGTVRLNLGSNTDKLTSGVWNHIIISIDMNNTSNRYIYINDNLVVSPTWITYSTGSNLVFTLDGFYRIGDGRGSVGLLGGSLAHIYLDHTYRDLSIEANRRKFITEDLLPVANASIGGQGLVGALSHDRVDTGTSGVTLNGTTDYFSRSSALSNLVDGKTFTFSGWFRFTPNDRQAFLFELPNEGVGYAFYFRVLDNQIQAKNTSGTDVLNLIYSSVFSSDVWNHLLISVDMDDISKCKVYINNEEFNFTASTFTTGETLDFTHTVCWVGARTMAIGTKNYFEGNLAHIFFDDVYRDLSVESNRRLFITADGKPATGQASLNPVIYMDLISDATNQGDGGSFTVNGTPSYTELATFQPILHLPLDEAPLTGSTYTNLGSGGDFTVNGNLPMADGASGAGGVKEIETGFKGLEFNGVNQYLSKATDMTGNADGKTFTFSCWIYRSSNSSDFYLFSMRQADSVDSLSIYTSSNQMNIQCYNQANTKIVDSTFDLTIPENTYSHLMVSLDLTNTSKRHVYINEQIPTTLGWPTYTNDNIGFIIDKIGVGAHSLGGSKLTGSLAHFYLDYTYRDLSIESNRRLFITSDLKPVAEATVATYSPILYLPMTNATSPGNNLGTGGDFTANGATFRLEPYGLDPIIYCPMDDPDDQGRNDGYGGAFTVNGDPSQSERGPNQYNTAASEFDGSADYLSRSGGIVGIADSKQITLSWIGKHNSYNSTILNLRKNSPDQSRFQVYYNNVDSIHITALDSVGTSLLAETITGLQQYSNHHITISFDLTNISNRHVFIDGVDITNSLTWTTYINNNPIFLNDLNNCYIANDNGTTYSDVELGEVYFDTSYIDLATDNPFWDSNTNKPKYLGEQGELPTGSQPLIYLPLRADDAGNNLGSGGDFTVNSGPFVGARGMSEYWARSVYFQNTNGNYLSRSSINGITNGKTMTLAIASRAPVTSNGVVLEIGASGSKIWCTQGNGWDIEIVNTGGVARFHAQTYNFTVDVWDIVLFSIDLTNASTSTRYIESNGVEGSWATPYTEGVIDWSGQFTIGNISSNNYYHQGEMGFLYFTTDYIDFSIEDNRRLFVDALGYPVDLQQHIDSGALPEGLIRMDFSDTADLGINKGTGGDFTVNGTVTPGADVDPNT